MKFSRQMLSVSFAVIAVWFLLSCGSQVSRDTLAGFTQQSTTTNGFEDALNSIKEQSIKDNLYYLASKELEGRGTGQPGNDKAAAFIAAKFKEYGLKPAFGDNYLQYFSGNRYRTQNVVGILPGNDPILKNEAIVVGAHFDHLGISEGTIYFGADDNASGTSGILEAVKAASLVRDQFKRTVIFIAFSAEEEGLVGSYYYVDHPVSAYKTVYMINLDMVGYLRSGKLYLEGGSASTFSETIIQNICKNYPTLSPELSSDASGGSDHMAFLRKNIPVVWLFTGDEAYYHSPGDKAERINYPGTTTVAKVTFELLWNVMLADKIPQPNPNDNPDDEQDNEKFTHDHGGAKFPVSGY